MLYVGVKFFRCSPIKHLQTAAPILATPFHTGIALAHQTSALNSHAQIFAPPKLRQIVTEAVFRRKGTVLKAVLTTITMVALLIAAMHRKYESGAKLVVQNVRTAAQLSTTNVDRLVSQGDISPAEINTEVDLLQSDNVARRALGQRSTNGVNTQQDSRAAQNLEDRLHVEAVHQTNIINLKVSANSPAQANTDLQHVIDAYFEERAGNARNSGAAGFFDTQLKAKSGQLDQDQAALTAFEVQHGIADLEDQTKLQVTRISGLQDQLAQAEATLAAQRGKAATQEKQLDLTPARSRTQQRTITNQYSQERLNTSLVDLENHRTELLKRYPLSDRQVIETEEKIATTRKAIADAGQHPAGEEATDINPVWQQLSVAVATSGGEISGLEGQRLALKQEVLSAQNRLNELEEATADYGALRRKVQQSQADYTLYAQRRDEARISEALDREKLFNVAVLEKPMASPEPIRPKPLLYLAVAAVFSLFLGTLLALYADLRGGQVHSPAQLEAVTGMRTLATFADENYGRHFAESNRLQYRRVLFAIRQAVAFTQPNLVEASKTPVLATAGHGTDWASRMEAEVAFAQEAQGACVAFTSALKGEGVSFVTNHLATEAARQASSRVVVFDMVTLLKRFESKGAVDLTTRYDDALECWVLADDVEDAAEAWTKTGAQGQFSARLRPLLQKARERFDLLVLNCPSLQSSTLAAELAPCVDGYVAVVAANAARKQNIEDLISQLTGTSAPVLGYLLNRRHYPVPRWLYSLLW